MHIVLVEPEIPQNTGNIARTCVMTNSTLHLVGKLGFSLEDRYLRRAGLDYWKHLKLYRYADFDELRRSYPQNAFYFLSTRARGKIYTDVRFGFEDFLVFGKETAGLPDEMLEKWQDRCLRIPMVKGIPRSLNLANSVALVLYEALRQQGFPGMA
ncbi:MAG: tRNA (cytidine(34)-2'-O)-methyltransferase [Firmicutes bacterium]|nr:tRNA (cytidine(34)-2'-O)-methyltransferase [Bacillota bacterium]